MKRLTPEAKRRLYRKYNQKHDRVFSEWKNRGYCYPPPAPVPFPEELRGMTCGAKTRAGTPCKQRHIFINGRCKLHGGLSTGPRTADGKARSAENGKVPKRKRTP